MTHSGSNVAPLPRHLAVWLFLSFAVAYFFSALVRGVTATLAPTLSAEFRLGAGDLGLLAGAYFIGFASTQLPLGSALDRHGPRRVLLMLLLVAVLGCAAFAQAQSFAGLAIARGLIGIGVSACLMAPMTAFRRNFSPVAQLRANSWMLMTGSLGMVASTLPVQWLLPLFGWRGLFHAIGFALLGAMAMVAWRVPPDVRAAPRPAGQIGASYAEVFRHPTFVRFAPMGFFHYGGLIAVQSLWAGPWLVQVCGWSPDQAATGLFAISLAMLLSFMFWGAAVPRLYARGWNTQRLVACGVPFSLVALALALWHGPNATAWVWMMFCTASTVVSLAQPAVGMAFDASLAGRALSAYNLVIFLGVFVLQWGIGLTIDGLGILGWDTLSAFRGAFALFALCCVVSYVWFLYRVDHAPLVEPDPVL